MIDFIAHNLAPVMFVTVMAALLLGYPVAFTLAAGGLFYFVVGVELAHFAPSEIALSWPLLQANTERVYGVMYNESLLAVPFFTFMGIVLERSRMAEDLLDTIGQLFGPVRGGLAYAVILVGALLAATTGVVAASVIAMGLISLPIMIRYGYDRRLAGGAVAASGTLAQIIPPSLVLIVMADQLGRPVGDMYVGALLPGLVIVGLYCAYVFSVSVLRPEAVPALPPEARRIGKGLTSLVAIIAAAVAIYGLCDRFLPAGLSESGRLVWSATIAAAAAYAAALLNRLFRLGVLSGLAEQVVIVLMPPLALIFLVLGTIFLGVATPTEGGAMGAVGALVLAIAKRRMSFALLRQALESTTVLSAFVMFILIGARVFGLTFYGVNGNIWVEELLLALPGGETGFLIVVTIIIFILGCFLDFFEIAFILIPLLAPVADKLGIDLIWFGVIVGVNLQTSFLTPPFGFALFYLRSVAPSAQWFDAPTGAWRPGVSTAEIYRGVVPYVVIQMIAIVLVIAFPGLVMHYRGGGPAVDPADVKIELPQFAPGSGGGLQLPPLGAPPPGLGGEGAGPPPPPAIDLSQPPKF